MPVTASTFDISYSKSITLFHVYNWMRLSYKCQLNEFDFWRWFRHDFLAKRSLIEYMMTEEDLRIFLHSNY
jgi:hypothetical protein